MRRSYQKHEGQQEHDQAQDALEAYVQEGARQMLAAMPEEEVDAFLGRHRYARSPRLRGYRNGYHPGVCVFWSDHGGPWTYKLKALKTRRIPCHT